MYSYGNSKFQIKILTIEKKKVLSKHTVSGGLWLQDLGGHALYITLLNIKPHEFSSVFCDRGLGFKE